MKRLLLLIITLFAFSAAHAQDCADIFISEYVEGWNNNKSLELYNPTATPIVLDNQYRLIRWSNGSSTSDTDPLYTLPLTGTIEAYTAWVIIQDTTKPGQDTMVWPELRKKGDWLAPYDYGGTTPGGNCVFWNGDDAVSVQKKQTNNTWKDIDIFGEIGVRPTNWQGTYSPAGAWTDTKPYVLGVGRYLTNSKTLIRKHTIKHGVDRETMIHYGDSTTGGVPNSFYALLEYDSMPANFFDSLGQHWCDCKSSAGIGTLNNNRSVVILPNPSTNGRFTIQTSYPLSSVEVISLVGDVVYKNEVAGVLPEIKVSLPNPQAGIYFVRLRFNDNQSLVKKIIVQ
jgi:hypothetical protein